MADTFSFEDAQQPLAKPVAATAPATFSFEEALAPPKPGLLEDIGHAVRSTGEKVGAAWLKGAQALADTFPGIKDEGLATPAGPQDMRSVDQLSADLNRDALKNAPQTIPGQVAGALAYAPFGAAAPLAMGGAEGLARKQALLDQGVDEATANKAGLAEGVLMGGVGMLPLGNFVVGQGAKVLAKSATSATAKAAAVGAGQSVASDAATQAYLNANGYDEQAKQFAPSVAKAAEGALFMGAFHGGMQGAHLAAGKVVDAAAGRLAPPEVPVPEAAPGASVADQLRAHILPEYAAEVGARADLHAQKEASIAAAKAADPMATADAVLSAPTLDDAVRAADALVNAPLPTERGAAEPAVVPPLESALNASEPVTESSQLAAKKGIYQAYAETGAPADVVAQSALNAQEKTNALGKEMTLWRSKNGALSLMPADAATPFVDGEKIATLHPDSAVTAQPEVQIDAVAPAPDLTGAPHDPVLATALHAVDGMGRGTSDADVGVASAGSASAGTRPDGERGPADPAAVPADAAADLPVADRPVDADPALTAPILSHPEQGNMPAPVREGETKTVAPEKVPELAPMNEASREHFDQNEQKTGDATGLPPNELGAPAPDGEHFDRATREQAKNDALNRAVDVALRRADGLATEPLARTSAVLQLRQAFNRLESGKDAEPEVAHERFRNTVESLLNRLEEKTATKQATRDVAERQRGADFLREKLLMAKRRGDITPETADMADWFVRQNPALVDELGLSVKSFKGDGQAPAGAYNPLARVMTLFKGAANDTTAVHEILHHFERLMPKDMQAAIRTEYVGRIGKLLEAKDTPPAAKEYLHAALEGYASGDAKAMHRAQELLGKAPDGFYQYFNPSEFWAVNATRLLERRYGAQDSVWARMGDWLKNAVQHVKGALGMASDAPVLRALGKVLDGDSGVITRDAQMLSEGRNLHDESERDQSFYEGKTVEVDGQRRPITNAKGQLVAPDTAGQIQFWRWYGQGSVDAQGRPMAVHGEYINGEGEARPVRNAEYFDRKDDDPYRKVAEGWKSLAKHDDVFSYKKSDATDFPEVMHDVDPRFTVTDETGVPGYEKTWVVHPMGPDGKPDLDSKAYVLQYPDGKVELNVDQWGEGGRGSALYAAVGNYAKNAGLVFAGDRLGISETGKTRRLENMVSLALKHGGTEFIEPHPDMEIDWKPGDNDGNLRRLLRASYETAVKKHPEIKDVIYDHDTKEFVRVPAADSADPGNGAAVGAGSTGGHDANYDAGREARAERLLDRLATGAGGEGEALGRNTLKRAILTSTFLRGGSVLDGPRAGAGKVVEPPLSGILYDRTKPDTKDREAVDPEQDAAPPEVTPADQSRLAKMVGVPKEMLHSAASSVRQLVMPITDGSMHAMAWAKDFASRGRKADAQWHAFDRILEKNYTKDQLEKMWTAADQENDLRREGRTSDTEGLNGLTAGERDTVELLNQYGQVLWNKAKAAGLVEGDGVAYWTPRVAARIHADGTVETLRGANPGEPSKDARNLRTSASSIKQRQHDTLAESEAALKAKFGDDAGYVKNIRVMPKAMAELERAIAGRTLVNQIKAHGQVLGEDLFSDTGAKNFVLIDHPALKRWQPKIDWLPADMDKLATKGLEVKKDGVYKDGKQLASYRIQDGQVEQRRAVLDETGKPVMTSSPLYVRKDFAGPLKAVFTTEANKVYRGYMEMKGLSMSMIMISPATHNMVVWGKVIPSLVSAMGWQANLKNLATGGVYSYVIGHRARADHAMMNTLIEGNLAVMGGRGMNPDLPTIANGIEPGNSLLAKGLGKVGDLAGKTVGDALRTGVDAFGHFWHETLLWNRVGDVQIGIALQLRKHLMDKGVDDYTATRIATHFANQYVGSIPREALSQGAHMVGNVALFSKSFTLTNLGAMKATVAGLPKEIQAQIQLHAFELNRAMGKSEVEAVDAAGNVVKQAQSIARRKAQAVLLVDMVAFTFAASALQSALQGNQFVDDLKERVGRLGVKLDADNPLSFLGPQIGKIGLPLAFVRHPLDNLASLSQTSDNPHDKEDRVRLGEDPDGNTWYMRLPVGKFAEELKAYLNPSSALHLLHNKLSPVVKALVEIADNEDFNGRRVRIPTDDAFKQAASMAGHIVKAQVPFDDAVALRHVLAGDTDNQKVPLAGHQLSMDQAKLLGTATGLTVGKLAGGDAVAELRYANREQQAKLHDVLPDVREAMRRGDSDGAYDLLEQAGQSPREIHSLLRQIEQPDRLSKSALKKFNAHADDDQRERMDRLRK